MVLSKRLPALVMTVIVLLWGVRLVGAEEKINGDRDSKPGGGGTTGGRPSAWKPPPSGYSAQTVQQWASAHAAANPGFRYVFVPPNVAGNKELANVLRVAAGKAWNHLSWANEIDVPIDISEGHGLAFAINASKVWGQAAEQNWSYVANCTAKQNIEISPAPRGECQAFSAAQPVEIPRFVFNATNGGPYANVHRTPSSFDSFTNRYNMSPLRFVSTHKDAIVCGPRITGYREAIVNGNRLIYSFTSDEFDGRDNGTITYQNAPTDQDMRSTGSFNAGPNDGDTAVASEWWLQLPNGFIYYGIHGEGSQERGKAEYPFAVDPANWAQDADLATGRSCITCHANGIQSAVSDPEYAGRNGWTSNDQLQVLYGEVRGKFQKGMRALIDGLSDGEEAFNLRMIEGTIEPVSRAIMLIEGPYRGDNGTCSSFCNGKYGSSRGKPLCETIPAR